MDNILLFVVGLAVGAGIASIGWRFYAFQCLKRKDNELVKTRTDAKSKVDGVVKKNEGLLDSLTESNKLREGHKARIQALREDRTRCRDTLVDYENWAREIQDVLDKRPDKIGDSREDWDELMREGANRMFNGNAPGSGSEAKSEEH